MKLKEGTYLVKKEDWKKFYKRAKKTHESDTFLCYPKSTKEDLIVYVGTTLMGEYGYDRDTEEIRERCKNRGLTLIEYIPKPKKPKALKLTLEEVMEDAEDWGSTLNEAGWEGVNAWDDVLGEALTPRQFNGMKTLFRKVIIRYLEEVYKEKESK